MTEREIQEKLIEILYRVNYDPDDFQEEYKGLFEEVYSLEETGYLTSDKGVKFTTEGGDSFLLTIKKI